MSLKLGEHSESGFAAAQRIYQEGGNSKSIASVRVLQGGIVLGAGQTLTGIATDGLTIVRGRLVRNVTTTSTSLQFQYEPGQTWCRVGGLHAPQTAGCTLKN